MKRILSLVLAAMLLMGCMSFASAEEEKITLSVWSFTNELEGMIEKYYKPAHPNVEIVYTMYPTEDYPGRVDSLLASPEGSVSDEAPDVFTLEAAFVKKYVNMSWTADLLDVGFTAEDFETCIPVMKEIGQENATGVQKALSWQSTPGALMYRASLAEEYLGVTSPEEFQEKVKDWDTFMDTAAELNEKSEGKVKMVTGAGDIWNAYQYNRTQGWVVDGKLVIDDVLYDYLDMLKIMEEDGLSHSAAAWQETWYAGMRGDENALTLCYFLPTWGLHYTLKPACAEGVDDSMTDEQMKAQSDAVGGTYGDWRMVSGPVGYSWGGTWIGANAAKVEIASDAKKEAIKEFIRYFTLDEDFLYTYAKDSGDFVSNNAVVEKIVGEGGTPNPFLGGQDHYTIFAEAANLANGAIMTDYDQTINDLWSNQCTTPYTKGELSLDEAIQAFKDAVAAAFTDIVVE